MDSLKNYLLNQPEGLKDWLDQFPWENFDAEITIPENKVGKIVIAKKVILQTDAEITSLLICQEAELGEGSEILGTMVCDNGWVGNDAECNYFIGRTAVVCEDAEIRSAIIADSLQTKDGAEIDELETLDSTKMDLHEESVIKNNRKLSTDDFKTAIHQRLQLVLESAIRLLT